MCSVQMAAKSSVCSFGYRVGNGSLCFTRSQVEYLGDTDTIVEQKPLTFQICCGDVGNIRIGLNPVLQLSRWAVSP